MAAGAETFCNGTDIPSRRPNDVFRALQHDSVSSEDGGENGGPRVVQGCERSVSGICNRLKRSPTIVPRHNGSNHTEGLVNDLRLLVRHHEVRMTRLRLDSVFAMVQHPLRLRTGRQDLAQCRVNYCARH